MNRKNIEERIWGKSIAYAREHGIISEEEANFLLEEYVNEFKSKAPSKSKSDRKPLPESTRHL